MHKTLSLIFIILLSTLGGTASGDSPSSPAPHNFAYGISIDVPKMGEFYRFNLPDEVYKKLHRADMQDIFIFDAEGSTIPFTVSHPETQSRDIIRTAVPFFSIYTPRNIRPDTIVLRIPAHNEITIHSQGESNSQTTQLSGYLLDLRALPLMPQTLHFEWKNGMTSFVTPIHVSIGSDLVNWERIRSTGTLAELYHSNKILREDTIDFSHTLPKEKYMLLSWPQETPPPSFTTIYSNVERTLPPHYNFRLISADEPVREQGVFLYDLGGIYPLMSINLAISNGFFPGTELRSRSNDKAPWEIKHRLDFYKIPKGGQLLKNRNVNVRGNNNRYWSVAIPPNFAPPIPPALEVYWLPAEINFLAQGTPPFTLAFGSEHATKQKAGEQLFALVNIKQSNLYPVKLGAPYAIPQKDIPAPIHWTPWFLYALLIVAVALLTGMAWRLMNTMKQK